MTSTTARETYRLPIREGGEDLLHTHSIGPQPESVTESCGACAQLRNDFVWLRYHDATASEKAAEESEAPEAEHLRNLVA